MTSRHESQSNPDIDGHDTVVIHVKYRHLVELLSCNETKRVNHVNVLQNLGNPEAVNHLVAFFGIVDGLAEKRVLKPAGLQKQNKQVAA